MRSVLDVHLSVQKYVAEIVGPSWEVRLDQDRGEFVTNVPVAIVMLVGEATPEGSVRSIQVTQAMALHFYPLPESDLTRSRIAAGRVQEVVERGFRYVGVGVGHPLRVPLFDYDAVDPVIQDSDTRFEHDYVSVLNFTSQQLPDQADPRRIRVLAHFTARWRRSALSPVGPRLEAIRVVPEEG